MRMRICLVALAVAALGVPAAPAFALSLGIGAGASLAPFQPGLSATGSGSLIAVDLFPWTLTVMDAGAGAGHMVKAATGCVGSDPQLFNALTVAVIASGVTSAGRTTISATATTVASGASTLTGGTVLPTAYSQVIPASQVMLTGCAYSLTATYTLQ